MLARRASAPPPSPDRVGLFCLLAHWAPDLAFGRKTYNSRTETVDEKSSFKDAWKKGRRCFFPAETVYEFCCETGKAVKWEIERVDGSSTGIAGLRGNWAGNKTGEFVPTFDHFAARAAKVRSLVNAEPGATTHLVERDRRMRALNDTDGIY